MRLNRDAIAALIPHAGRMVLLDDVAQWNDDSIVCLSRSHRDEENPLRIDGWLSSVCGVEFAAQAMAVHGALLARRDQRAVAPRVDVRPRAGFLASVRHVDLLAARLDDVAGDLTIEATRDAGDGNHILYRFEVREGDTVLVSGRAAVVLDVTGMFEGVAP